MDLCKILKVPILLSLSIFTLCYGHYDTAYFRNANDGFTLKLNWMSELRDDIMLSELAIPGTHASASYIGTDIIACQCLNFAQQLEYGIRVFDIRIKHTGNKFILHHGMISLGMTFGDFLDSIKEFLKANPTEAVLFRLSEERSPDNNTRTIRETLDEYLLKYSDYFLKTDNRNITLRETRGTFIILPDNKAFYDLGLIYSTLDVQDNYYLSTNWDLYYGRWQPIKKQLEKAIHGNNNTFYVNFLSGSGGSFPYFVASGHVSSGTNAARLSTGLTTPGFGKSYPDFPRVACFIKICSIAFEGTNILARDKIHEINSFVKYNQVDDIKRSVGIIMADFPGESLIQAVIDNNLKLKK